MTTAFYAVDRIEGNLAVLVADDETTVEVERESLPPRSKEGTVLRVRVGPTGPDWSSAEIDRGEEERRRREARETLDELKKTDPGGDITL